MDKITKLRQALADKKIEGRKAVESLNALLAKDDLTDEESTELEALEMKVDALEKEVERAAAELEKAEKAFASLATAASSPALAPAAGAYSVNTADPAQTHNFANIAEFAQAVHRADLNSGVDERLNFQAAGSGAPQGAHQLRDGTQGEGHLVPPAFAAEVWELIFAELDLPAMVDTEPTSSNHVKIPTSETTPWGAAAGGTTGVHAGYAKELTQIQASRDKTKALGVDVHTLSAFVEASDELLADAPRLATRLTRKAGEAIRWRAGESIMRGDGAGELEGYLSAAALVTVAKETSQAAATIVAANVAKMFSRMLGSSIPRAVWLANSDTLPQLMTMTLGDQPIWTPPASGFVDAPGGRLFGRPIILTEHCDTLGTAGDIQFIDPLGYYHTLRQGVEFAQSMHLYFDRNAQAFRWTFRHGGRPYLSAAVSPHKGSAAKSHFVVLATRA